MRKPIVIEVSLQPELAAELARLTARFDCAPDAIVAAAIERFAADEFQTDEIGDAATGRTALDALIEAGMRDIEAGRVIEHDDLMRELRQRFGSRRAA